MFTRSFTLPSSVDTGQVSADYNQGVLKIKVAKKAEAKPKQIKVNVGGEKTLEAKGPAGPRETITSERNERRLTSLPTHTASVPLHSTCD